MLEIREGFCQISVGWMSRLCIGKMTTAAPLPELLQAKLQPLRELCERYGVEKLELFGSAARGEFDPTSSDLDFIVQMRGAANLAMHVASATSPMPWRLFMAGA